MHKQEYHEYAKKRNPSSTWNYFLTSTDRQSAKCKICSRIIKTGGSSTSGLHGHLRSRHKIKLEYKNNLTDVAPVKKKVVKKNQALIDSAILVVKQEAIVPDIPIDFETETQNDPDNEPLSKKIRQDNENNDSIKLAISRMAALDGISISKFCTSIDLRYLVANAGYELPTSLAEVTAIILEQSGLVKAEMMEKLKEFKSTGHKFCLSFEKYQTSLNQFYVSIHIHNKNPEYGAAKTLGIFKTKVPNELDEFSKSVSDYLQEYDIILDQDVTAFTCDGTLLPSTIGSDLVLPHRQLCLAEGIQYAVIEVLYRTELMSGAKSTSVDSDDSDDEMTNLQQMDNPFLISKPCILKEPHLLHRDSINKVRKIIRFLKKSTSGSDILQSLVIKKYGKEINLILDCKTRWSTLCEMIGRFLKLKDLIKKCMQTLEMYIFINDQESQVLTEIHDSLVVIKATVTALCKPNVNLLTADAALRFMLRKLDEQDNEISRQFATTLRKHISERRTFISSVLQYLHDRYTYNNYNNDDIFRKLNTEEIVDIIVSLLERLKRNNETNQTDNQYIEESSMRRTLDDGDDPLQSEDDDELSIEKQLENAINNSCHDKMPLPKLDPKQLDLKRIVMAELNIYDSVGGSRGMYLTMVYEYLLSIVPVTAEAEQFFYSSKNIYKTLSSHPSVILNSLFLLRSFFLDEISER